MIIFVRGHAGPGPGAAQSTGAHEEECSSDAILPPVPRHRPQLQLWRAAPQLLQLAAAAAQLSVQMSTLRFFRRKLIIFAR